MNALVNAPSLAEKVRFVQVDEPAARPNEALVAVEAFSLNRGELRQLEHRPEGWRPGQDVAGRVARVAEDGSGPPAGTRVVAIVEEAGWAEQVAVPTTRLATLPAGVGSDVASTVGVAGVSALRAVRLAGSLLGCAVLVTGASGGLGHLLVQLAHAAGAQVTAIARPERAAWLRELGAAAVIGAEALEGSTERFPVVFETVGGRTFSSALRVSEPEGLIVLLGSTSGEDARFQIYDFFGHEGVRLQSVFMYTRPERLGGELSELVGMVARGQLKPYVGLSSSWSELPQVAQALGERAFHAKAVLTIPQASP